MVHFGHLVILKKGIAQLIIGESCDEELHDIVTFCFCRGQCSNTLKNSDVDVVYKFVTESNWLH